MAEEKSEKPMDPIQMQLELKRLAREEKMMKKQKKREEKMRKKQEKQRKKQEKMRAKLAAKGIKLPEKTELKGKTTTPTKSKTTTADKLPEAEIITAEADVWKPKSARKLDEIQKRIDRMDQRSIKGLKARYRDRYGEDLEVPDIYDTEPTIEVDTAEETGELEPSTFETRTTTSGSLEVEAETGGLKAKKKTKKAEKKKKAKVDRPLRLLDYRTPLYLRDKYGGSGGKGKRAGLAVVDIILNILLTIILVKIIATIVYVLRDRKEEKLMQEISEESAKPQPTS